MERRQKKQNTDTGSAVTALQVSANLLGLGQDADDFGVEVCYSVHVASVGTVIPAKVGFGLNG